MKFLILSIALLLVFGNQVEAQSSERLKVKASDNIAKKLAVEVKYRFPKFTKGELHYLSGQMASALFNYNVVLHEMHYIDREGDTLALDQEELIKHIFIEGKTFYYDKQRGYQELIEIYKPVKLTKYEQIRVVNREKISAYGQPTATGSIKTYSSVNNGGSSSYYKLNSTDILTLKKEIAYFLIDNNNRIFVANKSNILKLFSPHKKEIEKYLQAKAINFSKEEDLQALLQLCSQLS